MQLSEEMTTFNGKPAELAEDQLKRAESLGASKRMSR